MSDGAGDQIQLMGMAILKSQNAVSCQTPNAPSPVPTIHRRRETVRYTFDPDPSISAHELARLTPLLVAVNARSPLAPHIDGPTWGSHIEDLDVDLRRHFQPPREEVVG